jgi:uncharacterized protein
MRRPANKFFIALCASLLCTAIAVAQTLQPVPPLSGRIVDLSHTLSADQSQSLDALLKDFEQRKGSQIAVLIVPRTEPEAIEQYAIRVAEQWKLGRKKIDDGAILVVAKDERALRIEVGYGLEGTITDAVSKLIIVNDIAPKFKTGDYDGGILAGVDDLVSAVSVDAGTWQPQHHASQRQDQATGWIIPLIFLFFFLTVMISLLRGGAFGQFVLLMLLSGGNSRGGGGGFGGGAGGFSGGGGSSGGGGASGGW